MSFARTIVAVALLTPSIVFAKAPRTFDELSDLIVLLLNNATAVLIVAGIAIYFYGVSTNILNFSKEGGEKVRAYFLWGVIVLFVMVSIWGIVRLLQETLFGASADTPTTQIQTRSPDLSPFSP
jgi:hypothetical protein